MQTKNNDFVVIITGLLILATIFSVGFYVSRPQSVAVAGNSAGEQSLPNQNQAVNEPLQIASNKAALSQTVNDVAVEITSAKIISTGVEIGICYTTLDRGDWYPTPGHLFYGTYEIYPDQYGFTTEEKANGNKPGKRCALVYYRIDDLGTITAPLQFSLIDVVAHPREMPACQNFQERLDTNSKAKAYGLKAKCEEMSDGNVAVTLLGNNNSVAKDKASKLLDDIAKGEVAGPWVFTITEITK
jgi:hypothetical protein